LTVVFRTSSREVLRSYRVLPACTVALAVAWATPSMRFSFPTASSARGVHCPGLASPGTFRFQVFSTSYRLSPPRTLRVCFTPLTLLGFSLQSFLLVTSRAPPRSPATLLALPSVRIDTLGVSIRRRLRLRPRFRCRRTLQLPSGLSSRLRARCEPHGVTRRGLLDALLGFFPL